MEEYGVYFIYFLLAVIFINIYAQAILGIRKNNEARIEESKMSVALFAFLVWGIFNAYNDVLLAFKMTIMIGLAIMIVISIGGAIKFKQNKKMFIVHGISFLVLAFLLQFVTPMVA